MTPAGMWPRPHPEDTIHEHSEDKPLPVRQWYRSALNSVKIPRGWIIIRTVHFLPALDLYFYTEHAGFYEVRFSL